MLEDHGSWVAISGLFVLGYFSGTIPFGLVLTRLSFRWVRRS